MNVHIPSLFYCNAFLVINDGVKAGAGTITARRLTGLWLGRKLIQKMK